MPRLLLLMALLLPLPALAAGIAHNPAIQIDRPAILLGDVFTGLPAAANVEIATAPVPGRSVTYDYNVLNKLAQRYEIAWRAHDFNDRTVITRASSRITTDMIKAAVIAELKEKSLIGEIDVALDQRLLQIDLPAALPPDFRLYDFTYDKTSQRFRAELLAAVDTPHFLQVAVTGRAMNVVTVPVLNKVLPAGTVIGKADLEWIKLPADRAGDYLRAETGLVGMELRRQLPEQSALRPQDVVPPRVVLRGSLVTMQIVAPNMMLTAQGRALQDGAVGDVVRVTNTQSNRVVEATVLQAGIVQVGVATAKFASVR